MPTKTSRQPELWLVLDWLTKLLHDLDLPGRVIAILVNSPRKVVCYGLEKPRAELIFRVLNLGTDHPGTISLRGDKKPQSWKKGILVSARAFGMNSDDWIALVNIQLTLDVEYEVHPYKVGPSRS